MARDTRDWIRLIETYTLEQQKVLARHQGRSTLSARVNYMVLTLRNQFLSHYCGAVPAWRLRLRSFGGERTLPDFACIGAIKSGTSDLSTYLFQHPAILVPLSKEIELVNPATWRPYYPTVREKARVEEEHGKALCGYFNPVLHSLPHMDSFHAAKPDAKIVLMLRNPVDRAYSHYKWEMFIGGKRRAHHPYYKTFADYVNLALDVFPVLPIPSRTAQILPTGIYVKSVQRWIARFGPENVYILRAEDFFEDTASTVCRIHEFLGIAPIEPQIHPITNQNPIKVSPLDDETRRKLQAFYRPWNEKLYALIGRDMEWDDDIVEGVGHAKNPHSNPATPSAAMKGA